MKKFKNLKQSILNKNIFKRLRNTINANTQNASTKRSSAKMSNLNQLNTKKLYDLLDSSSTYIINGTIGGNAFAEKLSSNQIPIETISSSSLISKCNTRKELIISGKRVDNDRLNDPDINNHMLEKEDLHQIFFSYYIGHTILSFDTNMDGSASNFINKIIDTVCKRKIAIFVK